MAFCKFSPGYASKNQTVVDNIFINDFLPKAPEMCVKVYLLGLSKCSNADDYDNTLDYFASCLKIDKDDVLSCFAYWQELGTVQILSTDPVEIRYLPLHVSKANIKLHKVDKYTDFNIQLQEILNQREILPNEFEDYYNLIERNKIEESALIELIRYCAENAGFKVRRHYILTVVTDWIKEGIRSYEQVKKKISELGIIDDNLDLILSALGTKRKAQIEDRGLLNKWQSSYGFELNVIIFVIKNLKTKKRRLDINVLDDYLTKYFEMKLISIPEIENYENEKENMYYIAIAVNKELGIYYDDLTKEINSYVVNWINMGFDKELLVKIADNCFNSSIKTLAGLDGIVNKLFKLGINTIASYEEYLRDNLAQDVKIKELLNEMNITRNVNSTDRHFYKTWTEDWNMPFDVIIYAATLSKDKINAMQYLNKILSNWNTNGARTLDKVKTIKIEDANEQKKSDFIHNNYSKEQIASLITNLDEVEV